MVKVLYNKVNLEKKLGCKINELRRGTHFMAQNFKIFYSWQSDLPGKDTRNIIGDSIDATVKFMANTITIIPDRDTRDRTGSPNIEQTIFEKIDDCDLFIGDLSIVASYVDKDGNTKYSPNPNVLIELGYAVKVLGWENVICFLNTDFGEEKLLPFDLNHHRVTGYSLKSKEKAEIKKNLRDIISSTVKTLMEQGIRPKAGYAAHVVGSYDFKTKTVTEKIVPYDIQNCNFTAIYKDFILQKAKEKLDEAMAIQISLVSNSGKEAVEKQKELECGDNETIEYKGHTINRAKIKEFDIFQYRKVEISEKDKKELKSSVKKYFDINLCEDFFDLGNLEVQSVVIALPGMEPEYRGEKGAEKKYHLIHDCLYQLGKIELFEEYLKTFEGMLFFPLAIWNKTTTTDSDINVSIVIDADTAEVIIPDENLIAKDIAELAGHVYKGHFLEMLLKMPDNSDIIDGSDYEVPTLADIRSNLPLGAQVNPFGYMREPEYGMDDYVDEICKYIACPIETSYNEFDFHNRKLRPNEKNWLGKGILLRPTGDTIKMSYKITSERSDGYIEGVLSYEIVK